MSYATREASTDAGSPVELYEFRRGGTAWRYTRGAQDATFGTDVYTAVPMKRTSIEQTGEIGRAGLRITLARDVAIAEAFIAAPPSERERESCGNPWMNPTRE